MRFKRRRRAIQAAALKALRGGGSGDSCGFLNQDFRRVTADEIDELKMLLSFLVAHGSDGVFRSMAGLSVYLMGAISQLLVDLKNEWAVQTLVLFSFSLQVFLLMFAWTRRRNVATLTRVFLWLAYQLADSAALFTLGHMAIRAWSPDEQQLMAFWAPFLLVHLGGQDTITAYSFEDNRLWLRHLQTLVVQFLGAAYILYKYIPGSQRLIRVASILMYIVGGLKYGERIWALRSASMDSMWSSLDNEKSDASARRSESHRILQELVDKRWKPLDDEDILMASHALLDVCKGIFIGSLRVGAGGPAADCIERVMLRCRHESRLDMLMEMELSLMYDILYTKASVIHAWWGHCIRVISLVATAIAFLLFQITSKGGHKEKDIVITYVLLAGALLLETASLVRAAGSTWTAAFLHAKGSAYFYNLRDLRVYLRAASYRRWSGTVGQYNLLQSWGHDIAEPTGSEMAGLVGLESWWYQLHHSQSDQISGITKELVLREIFEMGADRRNVNSRPGLLTLQQYKLDSHFGWSVEESNIEDSIIAWHVATDLYCRVADEVEGLLLASQEVSRYMMFLFVVRPYMLPGPVRRSQYTKACDLLTKAIEEATKACGITEEEERGGITEKHRFDWAMCTVGKDIQELPLSCRQARFLDYFFDKGNFRPADHSPAVGGCAIARELRHHPQRLQVIFGVWVEMLCFVANHCSRESHASQLSVGGELVTIAWLMAKHVNLRTVAAATDAPESSTQPVVLGPQYRPHWLWW